MYEIDWLNILDRALWTFVEGFLIALPTTLSMDMALDAAALKSALLSAAMAGLSAVKTLIIEIIQSSKNKK